MENNKKYITKKKQKGQKKTEIKKKKLQKI